MAAEAGRPLTSGERDALSPGLADALDAAGAKPRIVPKASTLAQISSVWRGHTPILTLGDNIHWPTPPDDCCTPGREPHMAVLQHELQHVLEFAKGELAAWNYALNPRNWSYDFELKPDSRWRDFGAEQRAAIVEEYWRLGRGLNQKPGDIERYRSIIPWSK